MSGLNDRVAIVTGGGRGIGAVTASRLAARGLVIAIVDRDKTTAESTADAIRAAGGDAIAVQADVAVPAEVAAAVARVVAEYLITLEFPGSLRASGMREAAWGQAS